MGQTFISLHVKKLLKTQHGRNPINPAILAAIGHRFMAKKRKLKMRLAGLRRQRPETGDFFALRIVFLIVDCLEHDMELFMDCKSNCKP